MTEHLPAPRRPENLTREEAEVVVKEAIEQGWTADERIVKLEDGQEYNEGRGRVVLHDWDEINRAREAIGNDRVSGSGCTVELVFPAWEHPKYWVRTREEWRKLKAKVDELKEIFTQIVERGWDHNSAIVKRGSLGMGIRDVFPPGYRRPYGVSVGGMRTWRKVVREAEAIIQQSPPNKELKS